MAHIDENTSAEYCSICKNRVAMVEALFNSTYVCEQCMVKLNDTLKNYEIVKSEGIYNDKMQERKMQQRSG